MQISDLISILALIVSLVSAGFSISFGLRDRAAIRVTSKFFPAEQDQEGPISAPLLVVEVANFGRRDVYLEYVYIQHGRSGHLSMAETTWEGDKYGRCRLGEGDKYTHTFDPDSDGILKDQQGEEATDIFFQDSLNRRYHAREAERNIKTYLEAARDY